MPKSFISRFVFFFLLLNLSFYLSSEENESAVKDMPFQTQTPPEESSVTPQADQTETLQEETLPVPAEPSVPETGSKSKAVSEFAPVVPQNFRVSEGGLREVVITWSRPYDRPYRYIIEKSMNPEGPFIEMDRISPSKKTFTDKGSKQFPLEDNRSYFYRMISISKDGIMSEPTPVKESKTAPPPEAPTNLSVKANKPRGVFLTWDFSPSDWVVSHIIQRKQANKPDNFMDIGTVKELAYFQDGGTTDSILVDSTEYIYRIVAVNKVGSIGTPSDPVIVKTLPPPAKVSGIVAKEDEIRCVPLSWEVHSDPNVVKYILYRMDSQEGTFKEIAVIKGRENTSYLDGKKNPGNLLDQHTYYYSVYAENYVGAVSTDADIVSATTRSLPPSVESFCAAPPQSRQVMLAWEASKDDKVNGYQIWRSDGKIPFVQIDTVKGREQTAYVDKGTGRFPDKGLGKLLDDQEYQYKIYCINSAGLISEASEIVTVKTKPVPVAPTGLTCQWNGNGSIIELSWPANPETDIKEYQIDYAKGNTNRFKKLAVVSAIPVQNSYIYAHEGTTSKQTYSYRIQAVNLAGVDGRWSEILSVTPISANAIMTEITPASPNSSAKKEIPGEKKVVEPDAEATENVINAGVNENA